MAARPSDFALAPAKPFVLPLLPPLQGHHHLLDGGVDVVARAVLLHHRRVALPQLGVVVQLPADGHQVRRQLRGVGETVEELGHHGEIDLPPVPAGAGFADFVAWEAAYLASPAAQADLAYWQGELAGELPWLDRSTAIKIYLL